MQSRLVVGLLGGAAYWLIAGLSHAQCTKDTDCKGERVCEQGTCMSPPAPPAEVAPATAPLAPAPASAPASPAPAPVRNLAEPRVIAAPSSPPSYEEEPIERPRRAQRNWKRNSTGMMAGGIVMVSAGSVSLLVAFLARTGQAACERRGTYHLDSSAYGNCGRFDTTVYGSLLLGVGLVGAGIPLIIVGGKRRPLGTASLAPWATRSGGGIELQLTL